MNAKLLSPRGPYSRALALLVGSACVAFSFPNLSCAADQGDAPRSVRVSFADLDLSKPAGDAALYARIQRAARTVCSPLEDRSLRLQASSRSCIDGAVFAAVVRVNNPGLTAYYESQTQSRARVKVTEARAQPARRPC